MERDCGFNQMLLKCLTFVNFTKICEHVARDSPRALDEIGDEGPSKLTLY